MECRIQRRKLALFKTPEASLNQKKLNPESEKPWKWLNPFKWEGPPLSRQLIWNHNSPGHFKSNTRTNRLLKSHKHQNIQHSQHLSTPPEDQGARSFGCTALKPVSFSDKLHHSSISFRAETAKIFCRRPKIKLKGRKRITSMHFACNYRLRHKYELQITRKFKYYMVLSSYLTEKATLVKQIWWQKYRLPWGKSISPFKICTIHR